MTRLHSLMTFRKSFDRLNIPPLCHLLSTEHPVCVPQASLLRTERALIPAMSHKETVGRLTARRQSSASAPVQERVTVAVLPPSLPHEFAPPTGVGMADVFNWDESLNWSQHAPLHHSTNQPASHSQRKPSLVKKMGFTTKRERANPKSDLPPFVMRSVPYETWRKHYAKDKDGNYKGTHAPAEDCLLKPDDLQKWRFEEGTSYGDRWTRGKDVLPVYEEAAAHPRVPEYEVDYDGPPRDEPTLPTNTEEDTGTEEASRHQFRDEQRDFLQQLGMSAGPRPQQDVVSTDPATVRAQRDANGEVIKFENQEAPKLGWRKQLAKGFERI